MNDIEQEISELTSRYEKLEPIVQQRLVEALSANKGRMYHLTHRLKTADSIREKLERKSDIYTSPGDLRDILGFRVICYFADDVDEVARLVADSFRVDWEHSKDKRALIAPTTFGYLSLHYICRLPDEEIFPEDLRNLCFELQMRTMLQHTWAEIEHDLGYKTEFGIPRDIRRHFSLAAGLLEMSDQLFTDIKKSIADYKSEVMHRIDTDSANDLYLDSVTLAEFASRSKVYRSLLSEIAAITNAHITEADPESQLPQLSFLGIHTLGELVAAIKSEHDSILSLAEERLRDSGLDELSSTVGFYYLYQALLISGNYSPERVSEFFALRKASRESTEHILQKKAERSQPSL